MRKEYEKLRPIFDKQLPKQCANCAEETDLQIHHIVPLSLGGRNILTNLARLCTECHAKAHGGSALVGTSATSRRRNIRNGGRIGSVVPYGYSFENGKYEIDETNADVVRIIFRLRYVCEYSTLNIAAYLNHFAIPTAGSGKEWKHPVIKRMLDNPIYFGNGVYNGEHYGNLYPAIVDAVMTQIIEAFNVKYAHKRVPARNLIPYTNRTKQR